MVRQYGQRRPATRKAPSYDLQHLTYSISPDDLKHITDIEIAFGTTKFLPPPAEIPPSFYRGNLYTRVVDAMFANAKVPDAPIQLNEGVDPNLLYRCVSAHLRSWEPKHEDKIAGIGYMISLLAQLGDDIAEEA